ncbi:Redoxin-domain-containing protein, partial [Endogone sp. FLAS-F59071]
RRDVTSHNRSVDDITGNGLLIVLCLNQQDSPQAIMMKISLTTLLRSTRPAFFHTVRPALIQVGDRLPNEVLHGESPADTYNAEEFFSGYKKAVLIGVPGAFTPESYDAFKDKGVDMIACVAVNDAFVMTAWGKSVGVEDKIKLLADPKGEFTKALEMGFDASGALGGLRSKRFAIVMESGVVKQLHVEPDNTGLSVSLAENLLKTL